MPINWESSILWGVIGLVGGGIISFIFFLLSNKTKRVVYQLYSNSLISSKLSQINGLQITFAGSEIPNLVSTTLQIMNNGTDIIEPEDFAQIAPLQLKTDGEFLVYDDVNSFLTEASNATSGTTLRQIDEHTIQIDFDYWKKNDKLLLTILHTGKLTLAGTLKRGQIFENSRFIKESYLHNLLVSIAVLLMGFLLLVVYGLFGTVGKILNIFINIAIGYLLINYAQKKYQEVNLQPNQDISINAAHLDNISINNMDVNKKYDNT